MESTNNHSTHTNKQHNSSEGICVGIRCRPLNERELNNGQDKIFKCFKERNAISQVKENQPVEGQTYFYDKVFDESSTTVEVYTHIGKDIVNGVMNGINGTIFAYGQTSSGKTHTMLGGGDQIGVLNMAAQDIFNHIEKHPNRDFLLRASFVEIYNENIRDLFSDSSDSSVAIREDPRRGVYCEAIEIMISSYESICKALKTGIAKRAVEATAMNDTSSRSHTIFKLVIESKESSRNGYEGDGAVLVGTLNLVDLAGSESVKHTGAIGQRAKEGGKINQSLLSLSRVIHALSQPGVHVSFRDSKLTRLLQPSLSGNAKMSIVCCITPASHYLEETRSTLQFASRAKLVETHATVNEVLDESAQIRRLKKEFDDLKASLSAKVKSLEDDVAQKDLRILELSSSGESKDLFDDSRKRPRLDEEQCQIILSPEAPKSLASIKDVLLQLHTRRAQGLITIPKSTCLAMDINHHPITTTSTSSTTMNEVVNHTKTTTTNSNNNSTTNSTTTIIDDPLKLANVNPMTFGLRNLLMKDLENKLKTRNTNIEKSEIRKDSDDHSANVVVDNSINKAQDDMIIQLNQELNTLKNALTSKDLSFQDLLKERDDLLNQLELEMGANAEYVQEQKDLYSIQEMKLQEQQVNNQLLMNQLMLIEVNNKKCEEEIAIVVEKYETLQNDSTYQLLENQKVIQQLQEKINLSSRTDSNLMKTNEEQYVAMVEVLEAKVVELNQSNNQLIVSLEDMKRSLHDTQQLLLESQTQIELTNQQSMESSEKMLSLKDENSQLQATNSELVLQLSNNDVNNQDLQDRMNSEVNLMKAQLIELQSQNNQSSDVIVRLEDDINKLHTTIDELKNDLQTNDNINQSLQTTIDELQQALVVQSEANSEYDSVYTKVNNLTTSLETSSNLVLMLEEKNVILDATIIDLNQQIQLLNNEIFDNKANITINNDLIIDLEATLEQFKHDHEEAESKVTLLNDSMNELQMKHSEFVYQMKLQSNENESQLHIQIHSLEVEINELKISLQQSQEQCQQLTIKLDEVVTNSTINNNTSTLGTISRLNEVELSQEALDLARKDMEKQLASMSCELGNKDGMISKLMNTITELNERITIADQRLNTYDNSYHENDDVIIKKKVNQLQTNVDLLTNEKENLILKLQTIERDAKSNNNESIRQVENLEKLCNEQCLTITKLTNDTSIMISELKREANDLSIQRDNCEKRLELANKKIDSLTYEMEQLQKETATNHEHNQNSINNEITMEELLKEKQQVHDDLIELSSRLKKSQEESKKMRDLWEDSENLRQCSEDESKLLKAELDQALMNIEQLTIALEEATNEADKLPTIMEENSIDSDTYIALENEVEQLKQNKYDLEQQLHDYVERMESKNELISQYMNDISTLENDMMKLKQQVCELQTMLDMESVAKVEVDEICKNLIKKDVATSSVISNLELKVSELEEQCLNMNQKLQEQVHTSEDSIAECKSNSEAELSSLYQLINEKDQILSDLSNQIVVLNKMKEKLSNQINELTIDQQSKDSMINQLQKELETNHQTNNNNAIAAHEEMVSQLQIEKEYISKELSTIRSELQAANEHCTTNEDLLITLKEQIDVKDKRIEHLETCKLTKEQMEKIKVIKEERKKYQEDSRTLKKQLQQLTIKFDELRSTKLNNSSNGVGGGPATDYIISDLKVQLVTTSQQLSQSQEEVKLIKSKLKECAVQLKEYENDHMKVVAVLERYEVDTRGLLPLEHSVDDDVSIQHNDISDAVAQLGEKVDTLKAFVARKEIAKTQKVVDLEDMISNYTIELEDLKTQKHALEKRLEQLKNSAKNAREQNASMTIQIEELNERINEYKELVMNAEKRVVNSSDIVSSEIQALEEENIDLLKENKELRIEVSRYRSMNNNNNSSVTTSTSISNHQMLSANTIFEDPMHQVVSSPLIQSTSFNPISISGNKRSFGTDLSNAVTIDDDKILSLSKKQSTITDSITKTKKTILPIIDDVTLGNDNNNKARRLRMKAKALVDENTTQSQENAGECNQS